MRSMVVQPRLPLTGQNANGPMSFARVSPRPWSPSTSSMWTSSPRSPVVVESATGSRNLIVEELSFGALFP